MDVFEYGNPNASLILLQMIGDHDIEMIDHEFDLIQKAVSDELCLIACKVDDWNRDLSPWREPRWERRRGSGSRGFSRASSCIRASAGR